MFVAKPADSNIQEYLMQVSRGPIGALQGIYVMQANNVEFLIRSEGNQFSLYLYDMSEEQIKVLYDAVKNKYFLDKCVARLDDRSEVPCIVMFPRLEYAANFFSMTRRR